ncbi:MAG: alpha/beta fold hydrolase [Ilumatobacteraceae bacterium]
MSTPAVLPGAEPMSHDGTSSTGVLVIHGFTGNPSSMRGVAESLAAAGHHVELPRLPGHGTTVEDMVLTGWSDWTAEVIAAHERLAARSDAIVVVGLSMGGSLTLWSGLELDKVVGLVCVNPATTPQAADVIEMLDELLADGMEIAPAIGSDIADPDVEESSYDGAPLRALLSFQREGLAVMADRYGELSMPLLLITSRQDHVVEPSNSEHLAATYGGEVDHVWLDRSYHVATQDYDRDDIIARTGAFVARVAVA